MPFMCFLIVTHSFAKMSLFFLFPIVMQECEFRSRHYHECWAGQGIKTYKTPTTIELPAKNCKVCLTKPVKLKKRRPKKTKPSEWVNFWLLAHYLNNLTRRNVVNVFFIDVTLLTLLFQHFALCFIIAGV